METWACWALHGWRSFGFSHRAHGSNEGLKGSWKEVRHCGSLYNGMEVSCLLSGGLATFLLYFQSSQAATERESCLLFCKHRLFPTGLENRGLTVGWELGGHSSSCCGWSRGCATSSLWLHLSMTFLLCPPYAVNSKSIPRACTQQSAPGFSAWMSPVGWLRMREAQPMAAPTSPSVRSLRAARPVLNSLQLLPHLILTAVLSSS